MKLHKSLLAGFAALMAMGAFAEVPQSPTAVQPLPVGARAPLFSATTTTGAVRTFEPGSYKKPTVVLFYRGGWCPYCNQQLSDLHLVEPRLRAGGFEVVFLSTDRPELLYKSLRNASTPYTLLSDSRLEAARAFHIAFHVDDATLAEMTSYGIDLESTTGTKQHELPVPSVFIIDRTGTIRYVYSNPDYTVRLAADALWAAAAPFATVK